MGFPGGSVGKESACNAGDAGDTGLTPGSGRSPGGGHGHPLQYSCLGNPMDRGFRGVAELDTPEATSTQARGVEDRHPSPGAQPHPPTTLPSPPPAVPVSPASLPLISQDARSCDLFLGSHSPTSRGPLLHYGTASPQWASPPSRGPRLWVWWLDLLQVPYRPHRLWKVLGYDIHTSHTRADLRQCHFQSASGTCVHCSWRSFVWGPSAVKQESTLRRYCGLTVRAPPPGGLPRRADLVWVLGPRKLAGVIAVHLLPSLTGLRSLCAGLPHHRMEYCFNSV